jgi:hypothetical protein
MQEMGRIDDAFNDQTKSANKTEDAINDLEDAQVRAAKASREASEASIRAAREQSELFGDVASRTGQLSGAFAGLGAVGGQRLMIAADLFDVVEAGQLLRAELPALGKQLVTNAGGVKNLALQLGTMAAVTGALILAYRAASSATAETRKEVERYISIQRELAQVQTEGLTTDEIKSQIEELERVQMARNAEIKALEAERDERLKNMTRLQLAGEIIGGPLNQGIDDLNDRLNELATESEIAAASIEKLEGALTTEQRVTEEIRADILDRFDAEMEYQRLLETGTAEGVQKRIDAIEKELALNQAMVDELEPLQLATQNFTEDLAMFEGNISNLQSEMELLNSVIGQLEIKEGLQGIADSAANIASEGKALEELDLGGGERVDAIAEGAKLIADAEGKRLDVARETAQKIVDVEAQTATKRADLIASTGRKLSDLQSDFAQEQADAERDYRDTIAEITRDFQADSAQDLEDFQRDQSRAMEDHRDNMLDAAGRLDAVAILDEQRNFAKEQKRAGEDFKTEQKRRQKEFKTRLKDEENAFKKERQQAVRNYRERERDLRDSLNRQLADLNTAHNREIAELRGHQAQRLSEIDNALDAELRELTGFTQDETTIRDDHYAQMLVTLQAFVDEANATVAQLDGGGGAVGAPSSSGTTSVAVGQFPLSAGIRAPSGIASPLASSMAMMPPVSRSVNTTTNAPSVQANFTMPDFITPGMARNLARIVVDTLKREIA